MPDTKRIVKIEHHTDDLVEVDFCPGNGTRYVVVACKTSQPDRYCVSFPNFGSAYWVTGPSPFVHPNYVAEKWLISGRAPNEVDAEQMSEAIRLAVDLLEGKVDYPD